MSKTRDVDIVERLRSWALERLRSWAQNEEMIDQYYLAHGKDLLQAADELETLRAELDRYPTTATVMGAWDKIRELEAELRRVTGEWRAMRDEVAKMPKLEAELETLRGERIEGWVDVRPDDLPEHWDPGTWVAFTAGSRGKLSFIPAILILQPEAQP